MQINRSSDASTSHLQYLLRLLKTVSWAFYQHLILIIRFWYYVLNLVIEFSDWQVLYMLYLIHLNACAYFAISSYEVNSYLDEFSLSSTSILDNKIGSLMNRAF